MGTTRGKRQIDENCFLCRSIVAADHPSSGEMPAMPATHFVIGPAVKRQPQLGSSAWEGLGGLWNSRVPGLLLLYMESKESLPGSQAQAGSLSAL